MQSGNADILWDMVVTGLSVCVFFFSSQTSREFLWSSSLDLPHSLSRSLLLSLCLWLHSLHAHTHYSPLVYLKHALIAGLASTVQYHIWVILNSAYPDHIAPWIKLWTLNRWLSLLPLSYHTVYELCFTIFFITIQNSTSNVNVLYNYCAMRIITFVPYQFYYNLLIPVSHWSASVGVKIH